ncbi:MAG: CHRD domain-containing protein, partial [Deltaproteobacteria bacterium]
MSARSWSLILTSLVAAGSFGLGVHASSHQEGLHCVLTYGGRAMMAEATFTPNEDETQLHYVLKVHNIKNITMAHLHLGTMGEVSTPVVWLYPHSPPPKLIPRSFTGVLAEGTIT